MLSWRRGCRSVRAQPWEGAGECLRWPRLFLWDSEANGSCLGGCELCKTSTEPIHRQLCPSKLSVPSFTLRQWLLVLLGIPPLVFLSQCSKEGRTRGAAVLGRAWGRGSWIPVFVPWAVGAAPAQTWCLHPGLPSPAPAACCPSCSPNFCLNPSGPSHRGISRMWQAQIKTF